MRREWPRPRKAWLYTHASLTAVSEAGLPDGLVRGGDEVIGTWKAGRGPSSRSREVFVSLMGRLPDAMVRFFLN